MANEVVPYGYKFEEEGEFREETFTPPPVPPDEVSSDTGENYDDWADEQWQAFYKEEKRKYQGRNPFGKKEPFFNSWQELRDFVLDASDNPDAKDDMYEEERKRLAAKARRLGGASGVIADLYASGSIANFRAYIDELEADKKYTRERRDLDIKKTKRDMGAARRKSVYDTAGRVARAFSPSLSKAGKRSLYFGGASHDLYVPKAPSTKFLKNNAAGQAHQTDLSGLRDETRLSGAMPLPWNGSPTLARGFSTEALFNVQRRGLNTNESAAYNEIERNHDMDTKSSVVDTLMEAGVDKRDAVSAVTGLLRKQVVKYAKNPDFPQEKLLKIVKRLGVR